MTPPMPRSTAHRHRTSRDPAHAPLEHSPPPHICQLCVHGPQCGVPAGCALVQLGHLLGTAQQHADDGVGSTRHIGALPGLLLLRRRRLQPMAGGRGRVKAWVVVWAGGRGGGPSNATGGKQ